MSCANKLPEFKSLEEESDFWDTHSVVDFWDELEDVTGHFVDARPATKRAVRPPTRSSPRKTRNRSR